MPQRVTLWCKLLARPVEVELESAPHGDSSKTPGVPPGWRAASCLARDVECYNTGCPFTTDSADCPFGEVGELPEGPPERFDPSAGPVFESEWE